MDDNQATVNLTLPQKLFALLTRDAGIKRRSESAQVIMILEEYYLEREREAELFTRRQLREETQGVPVFHSEKQSGPGPVSKFRDSFGRGESE